MIRQLRLMSVVVVPLAVTVAFLALQAPTSVPSQEAAVGVSQPRRRCLLLDDYIQQTNGEKNPCHAIRDALEPLEVYTDADAINNDKGNDGTKKIRVAACVFGYIPGPARVRRVLSNVMEPLDADVFISTTLPPGVSASHMRRILEASFAPENSSERRRKPPLRVALFADAFVSASETSKLLRWFLLHDNGTLSCDRAAFLAKVFSQHPQVTNFLGGIEGRLGSHSMVLRHFFELLKMVGEVEKIRGSYMYDFVMFLRMDFHTLVPFPPLQMLRDLFRHNHAPNEGPRSECYAPLVRDFGGLQDHLFLCDRTAAATLSRARHSIFEISEVSARLQKTEHNPELFLSNVLHFSGPKQVDIHRFPAIGFPSCDANVPTRHHSCSLFRGQMMKRWYNVSVIQALCTAPLVSRCGWQPWLLALEPCRLLGQRKGTLDAGFSCTPRRYVAFVNNEACLDSEKIKDAAWEMMDTFRVNPPPPLPHSLSAAQRMKYLVKVFTNAFAKRKDEGCDIDGDCWSDLRNHGGVGAAMKCFFSQPGAETFVSGWRKETVPDVPPAAPSREGPPVVGEQQDHFVPTEFKLASAADLTLSAAFFADATRGLPDGSGGFVLGHEADAPTRSREHSEMLGPPWGPTFGTAAEVLAAFPPSRVSRAITLGMAEMAYSFAGVAAHEGPYLLHVSLQRDPDDVLPVMRWAVSMVLDAQCRMLEASSYFFQKYSNTTRRFMRMLGSQLARNVASCSALSLDKKPSGILQMLPADRQYVNCVHELACVPGEVLMYAMLCMARVFARYPTASMRSKIAVLFPFVEDMCPASGNTFGMLRRHFPDLHMIFTPRDGFLSFPNMVFVSKFPQWSYFGNSFLQRVLYPRVLDRLQAPMYSKRIAFVSVGNTSSTGRSFAPCAAFTDRLASRGFEMLRVDMPQDERLLAVNNADVLISSLGSNHDINVLLRLYSRPVLPTLSLVHTGYINETPTAKPLIPGQMQCQMNTACFLVPSKDNSLCAVDGSQLDRFLLYAFDKSVQKRRHKKKV
jgi:hypothetical protein